MQGMAANPYKSPLSPGGPGTSRQALLRRPVWFLAWFWAFISGSATTLLGLACIGMPIVGLMGFLNVPTDRRWVLFMVSAGVVYSWLGIFLSLRAIKRLWKYALGRRESVSQ